MEWQKMLADNITTAEELRDALALSDEEYVIMREEIKRFPVSITRYYLSLIDTEDPDDPIRKMSVPAGLSELEEGRLDTSGESSNTKLQGLQHKYGQTALVLTTSACAMLCRHCFRRRLVGNDSEEIATDITAVRDYIEANGSINNVLLSGGDAFLLSTEELREWLEALVPLKQLDFIRFGTRTPVTFPQRILSDPGLLELLESFGRKKQLYVVTHFNHPREFTPESEAAVKALQAAGVSIKNQTVLMKGINDDPDVLAELLSGVSSLGIVQHYVFQCRPVKGVKSRFQVPLKTGSQIVQAALARQNGLGKSADYTMSHVSGKIRILGETDSGEMLFQYKQARDAARIGRIFTMKLDGSETWLPEKITLA